MKAVSINSPENIKFSKNIKEPILQENEVLIKTKNCNVSEIDIQIYEGSFNSDFPLIPGHEFTGEIISLGKSTTKFQLKEDVVVNPTIRCNKCRNCLSGNIHLCENKKTFGIDIDGGMAEYVAVPEDNIYRLQGCSSSIASFAEPIARVLAGQKKLNIFPDSNVIIFGTKAMSLLHLQYCKNIKNANVTVVDICSNRLNLAKKLGAYHTILADENIHQNLKKICPHGWDIGIDITGNVKAFEVIFQHLARGGQALVFSNYPKNKTVPVSPRDIFENEWEIFGNSTYGFEFHEAVKMVSSEVFDIKSLIDSTINIKEVPETLQKFKEGEKLGLIQIKF